MIRSQKTCPSKAEVPGFLAWAPVCPGLCGDGGQVFFYFQAMKWAIPDLSHPGAIRVFFGPTPGERPQLGRLAGE
ncbi:MAG: hypothetical protein LBR11_07610 [Deltaproteobacteria bacterium]|nr:hypothetical protein [Deltaproteobacteria bacterium]